ncbi:hypothetical protein SAMN05444166_4195 [Singulisphaera sp. GP187]|uniref:hypothetical protein n=1 Tax=Singulisphaera sp. GP187 TaxID=1882752 RepID=UPI0009274328|nr:hypothetical protein [Singulisphaera sp. GP187]SIO37488.1 hypothetical protein SAMN05444166_4195 [Singulisphaera sp. GP187]
MGAPWSRVVNSTIKKFVREREINILRNRKLTALLKKKGRISFNHSGTKMDWKIKYKRVRMTPFADGDTQEFSRKDRNKTAELDWRGYAATDSMTKGEFLMNRNTEAIVKLYSEIASDLTDDMEDAFGEELYVNGYAPGNSKRIHGIESFLQATANAGNGAATPTGQFAGLQCAPGYYGGSWDSGNLPGWPNGRGDAQYDFWSPLIVDVGDSLFDTTIHTWKNNCIESLAFGIIKTKKSKSIKGQLDVIMVDDEMYRTFINQIRGKERINVTNEKSQLIALGFNDVTNLDGTDITWEYGIPGGAGYGFNCDMMEIKSQQAQLFVPEGPDQDIVSKSWRFSVDFFGNCVWNPKFFCKFINITNPDEV